MTDVNLQFDRGVARIHFSSENGIQLLTRQVRDKLSDIVAEIEERNADRKEPSVVLIEAKGRTFIAGADINELMKMTPESAYEGARAGQRLMSRIQNLEATTVIAIHAACAGGGCELALACDMRIASESAIIGLPETRIGVIPGWGGTVRATKVLGNMAARRMVLSGELLPASAALAIGLVDEVVDDDGFRAAVEARIQTLLSRGPHARARAKRMINQLSTVDDDSLYEQEAREFAACFRTAEPIQGMQAFLEKTTAFKPTDDS